MISLAIEGHSRQAVDLRNNSLMRNPTEGERIVPQKTNPEPDGKEQSERFIETANS